MTTLPALLHHRRTHILALLLAFFALCASASARSHARSLPGTPVPSRFVGVNAGGPLLDGSVDAAAQFNQMVGSGVESVRVVFNWAQAQPYASPSHVPPDQQGNYVNVGGVPTDFRATDQVVALAAEHGLAVLPIVLYAPSWDATSNPGSFAAPPARTGPYANYLTALIDRYGPHGSFWSTQHPRVAVRMWQIWNEENLRLYWTQPFARSYVALVRAAHDAIKRADGGAKVVLGAITNIAWRDIGKIYKIPGARRLFDMIAINGFTTTPSRVLEFLHLVRRAVNHLGDRRKPLLATEIGWPSSLGKSTLRRHWDTTEAGQARNIGAVLPMLAAQRRSLGLAGFYLYTWMAEEVRGAADDFAFAGLVRYQPNGATTNKPALAAFKRAALKIEGCRRKGSTATRCIK
jgi:hypothetical protein